MEEKECSAGGKHHLLLEEPRLSPIASTIQPLLPHVAWAHTEGTCTMTRSPDGKKGSEGMIVH